MRDVLGYRWSLWRDRIRRELERRIVWCTDARRNLLNEPSDDPALVAIIGREHYVEHRKHYPIRSVLELERVLRLELSDRPHVLTTIGPFVDERREVVFHELSSHIDGASLRALIWLPESIVLAHSIPRDAIVSVERGALRYFLAGSGASYIEGGLVRSAELFALALGAAWAANPEALKADAIGERLKIGLRAVPALVWWRARSPAIAATVREHWRPVTALSAAAILSYLVISSAYLAGVMVWRERELKQLGPEVATLLDRQRLLERQVREQAGIGAIVSGRHGAYRMWEVASKVWEKGGAITSIALVDGRVTLRGVAPSATDVLSALTTLPGVSGAGFDAPTRQNGAQQDFVIRLMLKSEASRG